MNIVFEADLYRRQPLACSLLSAAVLREKLAQAYLLSGRAAADKWLVARHLAAYLNCVAPEKGLRGSCYCRRDTVSPCQNCRWIARDQHPQAWQVLSGEGSSGKIPVEKARLLAEELGKTSRFVRLVLVPEASQSIFHAPAANALLKTIEEPGPGTLFLLFAAEPEDVLPTIVSRCQDVPVVQTGRSGYWPPVAAGSGEDAEESEALREEARKLISAAVAAGGKGQAARPADLPAVLDWAHQLAEMSAGSLEPAIIVDLVVSCKIEGLRSKAPEHPRTSLYLQRLMALAETAKRQMDSYVPAKAALESFALAIRELDSQYRGDASIVRH